MRSQDFLLLEARHFTLLSTDDRWVVTEAFKMQGHSELQNLGLWDIVKDLARR